ncbi:hypothetical protein ABK040_011524 [Willaertia magna]
MAAKIITTCPNEIKSSWKKNKIFSELFELIEVEERNIVSGCAEYLVVNGHSRKIKIALEQNITVVKLDFITECLERHEIVDSSCYKYKVKASNKKLKILEPVPAEFVFVNTPTDFYLINELDDSLKKEYGDMNIQFKDLSELIDIDDYSNKKHNVFKFCSYLSNFNYVSELHHLLNSPSENYNELCEFLKIEDKDIKTDINDYIKLIRRIPRSYNILQKQEVVSELAATPSLFAPLTEYGRAFGMFVDGDRTIKGGMNINSDLMGNFSKVLNYRPDAFVEMIIPKNSNKSRSFITVIQENKTGHHDNIVCHPDFHKLVCELRFVQSNNIKNSVIDTIEDFHHKLFTMGILSDYESHKILLCKSLFEKNNIKSYEIYHLGTFYHNSKEDVEILLLLMTFWLSQNPLTEQLERYLTTHKYSSLNVATPTRKSSKIEIADNSTVKFNEILFKVQEIKSGVWRATSKNDIGNVYSLVLKKCDYHLNVDCMVQRASPLFGINKVSVETNEGAFKDTSDLYEISIYSTEGTVHDYIWRNNNYLFSFKELTFFLYDLVFALFSVQYVDILHNDIKPCNIVFFRLYNRKEKPLHLRLIDFDCSYVRFAENSIIEDENHQSGTVGYRAPEKIKKEHLSFKSDVYSAGVVACEMYLKKYLCLEDDVCDSAKRIEAALKEIEIKYSGEKELNLVLELLRKMTLESVENRISFKGILSYMQENFGDMMIEKREDYFQPIFYKEFFMGMSNMIDNQMDIH